MYLFEIHLRKLFMQLILRIECFAILSFSLRC
jgi:hypothetical protein